jgi:hypothetical protein
VADTTDGRLPTAAYIEFAAPLPDGAGGAAEVLEARLKAASQLPQGELVMPLNGVGLLVCFAHPSQTLAFARDLIALARSAAWGLPALRVGVHVANMALADAQSLETTVSGSSIDGAVRIAGLAGPNQALATAQFQTVVIHLLKIGVGLLVPLGKRTTASGKTLDVFEITPAPTPVVAAAAPPVRERAPAASAVPAAPAASSGDTGLSADALRDIEQLLAAEMGPIAKLLVKQASVHLPDQNRFLLQLADAISEKDRRRAFLGKATRLTG